MVKTGFFFAALPAGAGAGLISLGWWAAGAGLLALAGFVLYFFRDPERAVPQAAGAIVSPADGRVLGVDEETLAGQVFTRVSIFLSVFDVHVNRSPIAGAVAGIQYRRGRFHVASRERAGRENEQNELVLEGEGTRVVVRQIAGLLARRIECWKKTGDQLARGERLGMIRFGSRVELLLDPRCRVEVRPGQHVRGGASVVAVRP